MALGWAGNEGRAQVAERWGYPHAAAYRQVPQHALLAGANAGLLPQYKIFTATAYTEKRFMLNELSLVSAGIVLPVSEGAFGLQASSFGNWVYSQRKVGMGYGRSLGEGLNAGVQFNYTHLHIAGYGNAGSLSADVGFIYHVSENIVAGLQLSNLAGTSFSSAKGDKMPGSAAAVIGYTLSDAFYISAGVAKELGQPLSVQVALQYQVLQKLQLTGGLETGRSNLYMGAGFQIMQMQLDAVASFHPQLGISPGLMLTFKKDKD